MLLPRLAARCFSFELVFASRLAASTWRGSCRRRTLGNTHNRWGSLAPPQMARRLCPAALPAPARSRMAQCTPTRFQVCAALTLASPQRCLHLSLSHPLIAAYLSAAHIKCPSPYKLPVTFLATTVISTWRAGYVHGRHPEMCPNKCKPDPQAGQGESPKQTLIREALEFQVCLSTSSRTLVASAAALVDGDL